MGHTKGNENHAVISLLASLSPKLCSTMTNTDIICYLTTYSTISTLLGIFAC